MLWTGTVVALGNAISLVIEGEHYSLAVTNRAYVLTVPVDAMPRTIAYVVTAGNDNAGSTAFLADFLPVLIS